MVPDLSAAVTRRFPRAATLLPASVLAASALLLPPICAHAQCEAIEASKLTVKYDADRPEKNKLAWKSKERLVDLLIADPTAGDTTLELFDQDGLLLSATLAPASASGWKGSGNPVRKWKYRGKDDPANSDGVASIKSSPKSLAFKGRGADLAGLTAPLAWPLRMRLTDSSGRCLESNFSGCKTNSERKVKCPDRCEPVSLSAPGTTDRQISIDLAASQVFPERLRAFNVQQQTVVSSDIPTLSDQVFAPGDQGSGRQLRLWYNPVHWPENLFELDPVTGLCAYPAGDTQPRLDFIVDHFAQAGDDILLTLVGTPAAFSKACAADCTANDKMLEVAGQCSCTAGKSFWPHVIPDSYSNEWQQHWACVLQHYALKGVRRFEIYNEPDQLFNGDPSVAGSDTEALFIEYFENLRGVLEFVRSNDPLLAGIEGEIKIGGPAMSSVDGQVGFNDPLRPPTLETLLNTVDTNGGSLDFVSAHYYSQEPGLMFAADTIGQLRAMVPVGWDTPVLDLNEWATALGTPTCDDDDPSTPGIQPPVAGGSAGNGCDHRGAGYLAYMLAGYMGEPTDLRHSQFELLERDDLAPCDMFDTGMGVVTAHGLPKPQAGVLWAASHMGWRLLGSGQEVLSDRSLGWSATADPEGVVHLLIGQMDSDFEDHFARSYTAAGYDPTALPAACGCGTAPDIAACGCGSGTAGACADYKECMACKLASVVADPDPDAALSITCPSLDAAHRAAVLVGLAAAAERQPLESTEATVGITLNNLPCASSLRVDLHRIDQDTSTATLWHSSDGPQQGEDSCTTTLDQQLEAQSESWWRSKRDLLWDAIRTPTDSFSVAAGGTLPAVTVPAYGSVYLKIY